MNIPRPTDKYDKRREDERNRAIEEGLRGARKHMEDVKVVEPYRLILVSPDGTEWALSVDNAGVLSASSL